MVNCDSNATEFLRNAYEGALPRARGWMSEAGSGKGLTVSAFLERTMSSLFGAIGLAVSPKEPKLRRGPESMHRIRLG